MITIRRATIGDIDNLANLFNQYIIFYRQPSDLASCTKFLKERLVNNEATAFIASMDEEDIGFTLLYPSFSSVSRQRVFVLNDLFVDNRFRNKGVATLLMNRAVEYGRNNGAIRLHLETEVSNTSAQALYEKEGWSKETAAFHYSYTL